MSESLENSESQHNYVYGGFQRISSYDPNMCTTAARFSPFYDKANVPKPTKENTLIYKSLIGVKSPKQNEDNNSNCLNNTVDTSKVVDPKYFAYNSDISVGHQSTNREVLVNNEMPSTVEFNEQVIGGGGEIEIDYIQQIAHANDEENGEPIATGIVIHRSPNGHLYQNFYVTNEEGTPEEVVELIPIDPSDVTRLGDDEEDNNYSLQPYAFPTESHIDDIESHHPINTVVEYEENEQQMITTEMLTREQQRILLETTMSPLLAAVNDITQRDKQFLSCLNRQSVEEQLCDDDNNEINAHKTDSSEDDDDYVLVADRAIESRAKATLPTNYLYLGPINADTNEPSVYAAKEIRQRTKFGPFEGEIRFTNDIFLNILRSQHPRHYPLLLVGKSKILIVTNENTSNWMRFVRLAKTFTEQNLQIIEENGRIFFKCNRDIHPKEELRVGYHSAYAEKYNLSILKPSIEDTQKKYECDNPWMCFECDQRFPTSQEMQTHLKVHDLEDASCIISKRKIKRKRKRTKFKKISELPKNSSRCLICFKVFMTNASLKKHFALHIAANKTKTEAVKLTTKRSVHKCQLCSKRFLSEDRLKSHERAHSDIHKPHKCSHCDQRCATPAALSAHVRSHTNRLYSCVFCQETFKYVLDFKKHVLKHRVDGFFVCFHCKKNYKEYHIVRRHIRIFHPAVKYPCNECDRLFLHMSFLRRHKATHAKKKTIQCSKCEQKFEKRSELRQHTKTFHKGKTKIKKQPVVKEKKSDKSDRSPYQKFTPKKDEPAKNTRNNSPLSENFYQSQFKCEECKLSFKRRGMLVNHLVKRHPEQNIDSIEELNQPIVKIQTMFKCPHCPKLYKNNAKRKGHIVKNHPGMEIPPSFRKNPVLIDPNVQTVGCIKADVQKCHLCYKQYVSRMRLITHYRKSHMNESIPEIQHKDILLQNLIEEPCMEPVLDIYRQPVSPENKLLKLSSAALELSSIEDRKYFDFLNEKSDTTDIGNRNSYKIEESEFVESSSNADLNRLPELFEESITCI